MPATRTRCLIATLFVSGLLLWMSVLFAGGSYAGPEGFDQRSTQPAVESVFKAPPRPEITSDPEDNDAPAFPSGDACGDGGDLIASRSSAVPYDATAWALPAHTHTHATISTSTVALGGRAPPEPKVFDVATSMTMPARH